MKNKLIIIMSICLLFVGFSTAQEKSTKTFRSHYKYGKMIVEEPSEPSASSQATKAEKSRIYLLTCFASSENGEGEIISNCIKLSDVSIIYFWTEVFALLNTEIRFHIIWSGPESVSFTSEWFTWNKNECSLYGVSLDDPSEWKKGVYTVIFIAETKELGAGVGLQKQCVVRFY